jgi:hypothetical protein
MGIRQLCCLKSDHPKGTINNSEEHEHEHEHEQGTQVTEEHEHE